MARPFIREKKIDCGGHYREVDLFTAWDRKPAGKRGRRTEISRPTQRNLNEKNARRYFVQLAEANFGADDWSVDLTYFELPESLAAARRMLANFLGRLKYLAQKIGVVFKWLAVTSDIDGATGEPKRVHHHLFISGGLSFDQISDAWRHRRRKGEQKGRRIGRINIDRLQPDDDFNISGKAYYFGRQGRGEKRWSGSRNLTKPVRLPDNDSAWSMRQLRRMCELAPYPAWGKDVEALPFLPRLEQRWQGWRVVSWEPVYSPDSGWIAYIKLRRKRGG